MHGKTKLAAALATIGFLTASAAVHADPVEDTLTVETDDGTIGESGLVCAG